MIIVVNKYGSFSYDRINSQWICIDGRIPGSIQYTSKNCYVHSKYAQELTKQAFAAGFSKHDFVRNKPTKTKKKDVPIPSEKIRVKRASQTKLSNYGFEVLDIL